MRTKQIILALFILPIIALGLQSCQQTKEYHVMLRVYNLTTTDTIQFGSSSTSVLSSAEILPGSNSSIEVRKIDAVPYYDVTSVTCYVAKNGSIVAQMDGERVVLNETHLVLSFHWNGSELEFMN